MSEPVAAAADLPTASGAAARLSALADRLAGLSGWRRLAVAIGLGGLASLAMPPVGAVPVLLLCFPGLLWLLDGVPAGARGRWAAFLVGWGFGFGFFVLGLYWIAFALTVDLARFFWMLPFAVAGLPAFLAIFSGLATLATALLPVRGPGRALALALLWGVAEWLRGHVLTGFPWNLMGYGWVEWPSVLQSVSVIGIYGLSLLTVAVAVLPAALLDRRRGGWSRPGAAALATGLALFVLIGAAGAVRLAGAESATVPGVVLRLVQPNIAQTDKWTPALYVQHLLLHRDLSRAPGPAGGPGPVTHVIWPETAVPWSLDQHAEARRAIAPAAPAGGLIITGAPRAAAPGEPEQYWNSLFAIGPDGGLAGRYDKFHLVPFGEYVPLRGLLPIERVTQGRVDFSAGPGPRTLILPGLPPVSPLICYEVIFPGAVTDRDAAALAPQPAWLLNLTNDAWYGRTAGPHQHFAIARTRAVEEGLPLVRVAGTGISGVVDAHGRITARLGLGERGVIDAPLPVALARPTLFARWGDLAFWAIGCGLAGAAALFSRKSAKELAY